MAIVPSRMPSVGTTPVCSLSEVMVSAAMSAPVTPKKSAMAAESTAPVAILALVTVPSAIASELTLSLASLLVAIAPVLSFSLVTAPGASMAGVRPPSIVSAMAARMA